MSALGKVRVASLRLLKEAPFHAGLVSRWKVNQRDDVGTMAVGFGKDHRLYLYFNEDFVNGIRIQELESVLMHEINHVTLGHLSVRMKEFDRTDVLLIALELSANEYVKGPLPGHPILLRDYPQLEEDQSYRQRYKILSRMLPLFPSSSTNDSVTQNNGVQTEDESRCSGSPLNEGDASESPDPSSDGLGQAALEPIDDHSVWSEHIGVPPELVSGIVQGDIQQAFEELTDQQRAQIPKGLLASIKAGLEKSRGVGAGNGDEELDSAKRVIRSWAFLNSYIGKELASSPTFNFPPRRLPELVGIVPGRRKKCEKPKILAAIDTSGSMTVKELEFISAELHFLSKRHEITVAECDYDIQRVYPLTGRIKDVKGRGGTDFHPIFERDFLRRHDPDLILCFTDGDGPAPETPPRIPVVWVLYSNATPASWGKKIRVEIH